ncbi:hypothetical protein L3055_07670 [Corynebacterium sp. MC-02]|uniref:hypothetical protein n=1 Tax=Corynebacterium pseudokroppenstedtii TaxID=2804917 RepID=UPI001F209A68|nr:hypothetical protein [Corynebacterium pseudokroppenstedtii]MCF8703423.1 hypothetical protein [Corynebacterium pseudokroppenstedtii]
MFRKRRVVVILPGGVRAITVRAIVEYPMHYPHRRGTDAPRHVVAVDVSNHCCRMKARYCWSDGENAV